ncbi:MAG: DUF1284 domain-containing protein [Clostridiales bacterium]|nr:DUF1284 domain-containing protein [Clostridiales bacterium]
MKTLLRPHHGLCIQFYEGKGYNEEFKKKMDALINQIQRNPRMVIQLHTAVDVLCSSCPNNIDSECISYKKVNRFDEKVLSYCDINSGQVLSIQEFLQLVKDMIIAKDLQPSICSDCEWYSICNK